MNQLMNINEEVKMSSLEIAEICDKRHDNVVADIRKMLESLGIATSPEISGDYTDDKGRKYPCYYLNFELTTTLMTGYRVDLRHKVIKRWMELEKGEQKPTAQIENLSPQLQLLISIEVEQKAIKENQEKQAEELQGIRNVIALNPIDWRREAMDLIKQMALKLGGYEFISSLCKESYDLLDGRMAVSLQTRLTNKRRRMAEEGICKSRRDKLNPLDVIGEDKKLVEGYVAIIKEMAIKYGVGVSA